MTKQKRIFVSFQETDKWIYDLIRRHLRRNHITAYDRNLYNFFGEKSSRLFNPLDLNRELGEADHAIVVLSQHSVRMGNPWLNDEFRALYMLEQFRRTNFIVPVLIGEIEDSEIPTYLRERPERFIDFRRISEEQGLDNLVAYISKLSKGKIFIGHGRSLIWKDLREFLQDRLELECDDFEATPPAGMSVKERLSEMLIDARFAFLVMTAEDVHVDEGGHTSQHARENVIHEVGLFQGKLGFERAIILLEEGCGEFSNKSGVIHISFRRGEISSRFEEIRRVLEREGITS
jgi:predicted nucleotide-binding protein